MSVLQLLKPLRTPQLAHLMYFDLRKENVEDWTNAMFPNLWSRTPQITALFVGAFILKGPAFVSGLEFM